MVASFQQREAGISDDFFKLRTGLAIGLFDWRISVGGRGMGLAAGRVWVDGGEFNCKLNYKRIYVIKGNLLMEVSARSLWKAIKVWMAGISNSVKCQNRCLMGLRKPGNGHACADIPIWSKKGTRKGLPRIRVRRLLKFNLLNKVLKALEKKLNNKAISTLLLKSTSSFVCSFPLVSNTCKWRACCCNPGMLPSKWCFFIESKWRKKRICQGERTV